MKSDLDTKRLFDLVVASIGAIVAAPVILVCMAAIRIDSPGAALFRQTRVGKGEREFTCLKLRTMRIGTRNAPSHETGSSSVTSVGRFLRASKLDELPQLWNILKGDMSLVGPRPCLPEQATLIEARRRYGLYDIRPGVTGVAQVAGVDMSAPEELAALDATYLQDKSLKADVKLIVATLLGSGRGDRVNSVR